MQTDRTKKDGKIGQDGQDEAPARAAKRTTKLYDVFQIGDRFDKLRASNMRPLDATVHAMRDRLTACLADGYSITDIVELLQQAGIDGTDRQLRYALDRAGIHRRQTRRSRSATVRRQAIQADTDSGTAESGVEATESGQDAAIADGDVVQNSNEYGAGSPSPDTDGIQTGGNPTSADRQIPDGPDGNAVQPGDASGPAETRTPFSPATDSDQPEQGDDGSDAPSSGGDATHADAVEQQARRTAWMPRPGALNALGNVDMTKSDRDKALNERRGRK